MMMMMMRIGGRQGRSMIRKNCAGASRKNSANVSALRHYTGVAETDSDMSEDQRILISQIYLHSNFPTKFVDLARLDQMTEAPVTVDDIVASARDLQQEVPIRLARRIVELESLPAMLADHPSIRSLKKKLIQSFADMKDFPEVVDEASEREYMILQKSVRDRHQDMYNLLVDALVNVNGGTEEEPSEVTSIIDGFYSSRISLRMLIDHHNAIKRQMQKGEPIRGIIDDNLCLMQVINSMIDDARSCCTANFGFAPEIHVECSSENQTISYVRDHVERIMYAMLLNASRATAKNHLEQSQKADTTSVELPPVSVFVTGDADSCTVRVSDRGGSLVPFDDVEKLFKYSMTLSHSFRDEKTPANDPLAGSAENIAGFKYVHQESASVRGFGLPVSRLYARYFGGDLRVIPMGDYGNESFVHLKSLTSEDE